MSDDQPPVVLDYEAPPRRRRFAKLLIWWNRVSDDVGLLLAAAFCVMGNALAVAVNDDYAVFFSGYALLASIAVSLVAIRGREGRVRYAAASRCVAGLVAMFCIVGEFRVWSCPHATYVGIGPLSVAVEGKPCHNPQPFRPFWPISWLRGR